MQNYKEINGNDYVKDSRTTINETMRSIQSMNSGTAFPTTNLFEGMKCYRTDLKKTYTLTDVANNTWVEDDTVSQAAHADNADNATHAAAATTVNATAPNGGAADLAFGTMANNDYARIRVYGKDDNGALEIATADAGYEPIYARQYSGNYDWPNGRPGTVVNEAAILDGNGNTKFPKNVTAASFTGPLNGNAATATNSAAANKVNNSGDRVNLASGRKPASGLQVFQCYSIPEYPQQFGNVLSIGGVGDNEFFLGWQANARPYYRSKVDVSNDWTDWKALAYISDINSYAPTKTGSGASGTWPISVSGNAAAANNDGNGANIANTYLKRSGGTMKGALNFANGTWNLVGDDCYMGDHNINGTFFVKGANGETGIALANEKNEADYARISYGGGNINFNKTIGGNISGNAATATNADKLDGYHASDIINRITAANTGGIVAASLTANGYVKFANGLILQWGTRTEPKVDDWVLVTTTFPIAFASACFSVTCCDELTSTYDGDVESFVRNIKTNSVDIRYRSDHLGRNLRWLALGI